MENLSKGIPEEIAEELQHEPAVKEPLHKKPKIEREKVKLSIGDAVIVADKQTLIQACPYFASMLRFHADNNIDSVLLVPTENVDVDVFLAVLYSLSNANVHLDITVVNMWDLIVLSKYFQLDQLEQECILTLRKLLPTLDFDQLCSLWRKGYAFACDEVAALTFAMILLKMESASQSLEFLGLSAEELVALLSDKGFLPLLEGDVSRAVAAWCEHDPENRKTAEVLQPILTKVMWDASAKQLFEPFSSQFEKPGEAPKRVTDDENQWIPDDELLNRHGCENGVIVGKILYTMDGTCASERVFSRINLNNGKRTDVKSFQRVSPSYESLEDDDSDEHRLCLVKLRNSDRIGCLISYWENMNDPEDYRSRYEEDKVELGHVIMLYDTTADTWMDLPSLPLPRTGTAIIQLGTFLYIIGGEEHKACGSGGNDSDWPDNAHHCYRLNLSKLPACREEEWDTEWERIADLNAPRKEHSVKVKYGRVIVYGGQTADKLDGGGKKFYKSQWSEAYDAALNIWTVFKAEA